MLSDSNSWGDWLSPNMCQVTTFKSMLLMTQILDDLRDAMPQDAFAILARSLLSLCYVNVERYGIKLITLDTVDRCILAKKVLLAYMFFVFVLLF